MGDSPLGDIQRQLRYWLLDKGDTRALLYLIESFTFDAEIPHGHLSALIETVEETEASPSKIHELMELGPFNTFNELKEYLMDCLKEDDAP
jgi:hypothetical protein